MRFIRIAPGKLLSKCHQALGGWPEGVQPGLTQPVAVLLNETAEVLALASEGGFRCFTSIPGFRAYIEAEILKSEAA